MASDKAAVSDSVLAPDGPSYRALVFNNQAYISLEAASKVLEFAKQSLPIVVLAALPDATIGTQDQDVVSETMESVAKHTKNVKFVAD